jgi:quercetin dioxygenase-like cupin family protein
VAERADDVRAEILIGRPSLNEEVRTVPSKPAINSEPIDELAQKLKRTEIQHRSLSIAGREVVQVLTEIPCGVESGWHIHPGEEIGYILAGTVRMMIQGQPTLTLHTGDGFLITPRLPHNALDVGPETGQMLSTYIVAVGEPLATFVDGPPMPLETSDAERNEQPTS